MDARAKIRAAIAEAHAQGGGMIRSAAGPVQPEPPQDGQNAPPGRGDLRSPPGTAQPGARQIPKGHKFDPKALKPLARMLWAMSVSLGHALQAYRTFNRVKSSSVSPDGMLGGRGYIMKVTELRQKLYDACEALSMISDTVHDEINAPHWKPQLAELDQSDMDAIDRLMGESQEMLDHPDEEVDEEEQEVEKKGKPSKKWSEPGEDDDGEPSSDMPTGGSSETNQRTPPITSKQASMAYDRRANSSIPTQTLPGPRVQHLDRGDTDQTGPFGSYNNEETPSMADEWSREDGVGNRPNYGVQSTSGWVDETETETEKSADSALPADPDTKTQGFDFGIGYGNGNDAHGQGAGGYGELSPGQGPYGVLGPSTGLPEDPGGATKSEDSDTTPTVENHINDRMKQGLIERVLARAPKAVSQVPDDDGNGVARSDYYDGWKPDNDMNTAVVQGQTVLPGDGTGANLEFDKDTLDTGYRYERQDEPYTKWDDTTHNQRPDWTNMRDPQGPYVKQ